MFFSLLTVSCTSVCLISVRIKCPSVVLKKRIQAVLKSSQSNQEVNDLKP